MPETYDRGYDPFTTTTSTSTTTTTTVKPFIDKNGDRVEDTDFGMPTDALTFEGKHPVDQSDIDIDPKPEGNNTIPYQRMIDLIHLLERTSVPTVWEHSYPCPCYDPDTNQPRSDCPLCHGKGILYKDARILQVAFQSNNKNPYNGQFGENDLGTTIATPQMTENGVENGISFRDRLTVYGLTIAQTYMYNVTRYRKDKGMYIPYLVAEFNNVYTLDNDGQLKELHLVKLSDEFEEYSYKFNSKTNRMYVSDDLLDKNITMNLTTPLRYYVVDIAKETRYAQVEKQQEKEATMNYGDPILTKYLNQYHNAVDPGIIYMRQPKKLILRREDMYIPATDISNSQTEEPVNPVDPKATIDEQKDLNKNISDLMND